ncbi:MAG TPA: hypothetical protein VFI20_04185 [Terracidiphilus sp.]|nr:hypothetical protein [Terracidiphilus sp.]
MARIIALAGVGLLALLPATAQYPGQIEKKAKDQPVLRSVGVLEWTGEAGKPKTSRLVPVCVFDGQDLQDGGVYLARPQPLAVDGGVEYVLEKNGKKVGLYDIDRSGQQAGTWVGFGAWKPMPPPKQQASGAEPAKDQFDDKGDGRPVLHRSKEADSSAGRKEPGGAGSDGSGNGGPATASDTDRPTPHRETPDSASAGARPAPDPDRPTLTRPNPAPEQTADVGNVEPLPAISDPDRPRLLRGKPVNMGPVVTPTMVGLPAGTHQMVAVSDATNHPDHPWTFTWSNPADELKMKAELEDAARQTLKTSPPSPEETQVRKAKPRAKTRPDDHAAPMPLEDEQFRVFQLTYGSGATLVLTARTGGPLLDQRFVTLIAQPDLYGNLLVIFKHVTDGRHLDVNPRMRLVDAVDAMADNRGELLFELRGRTHRRFALYRVLRGTVEQIFATGGGYFGSPSDHQAF